MVLQLFQPGAFDPKLARKYLPPRLNEDLMRSVVSRVNALIDEAVDENMFDLPHPDYEPFRRVIKEALAGMGYPNGVLGWVNTDFWGREMAKWKRFSRNPSSRAKETQPVDDG